MRHATPSLHHRAKPSRQEAATPAQAIIFVLLLYVGIFAIGGVMRRLGVEAYATLVTDICFVGCGLALVNKRALHPEVVVSAGPVAALGVAAIALLGTTATAFLYLRHVAAIDVLEPVAVSWGQAFHSSIAAPIGEELVFVGLLYSSLRGKYRILPCTLVVAILFTAAHLPPNLTSVALRCSYIVISCLVFEAYGALILNIVMHAVMNGSLLLVGVLTSDHLSGLQPFVQLMGVLGAAAFLGQIAVTWRLLRRSGNFPGTESRPAPLA